jgi:hypothetical protein
MQSNITIHLFNINQQNISVQQAITGWQEWKITTQLRMDIEIAISYIDIYCIQQSGDE